MITPDPQFRVNPNRAIFIEGDLYDSIIPTFLPQLLKLLYESREPITVYINSPGGSPETAQKILKLLSLGDQNESSPCSIITCATGLAASAAADLLSAGDYAVALPSSIIHFHGLRQIINDPLIVTAEKSSDLAYGLRIINSEYARELASKTQDRFIFRYVSHRDKFPLIRAKTKQKNLSDLECFVHIVKSNLSESAGKVCDLALKRNELYSTLLATRSKRPSKTDTPAKLEAKAINKIIEYEIDAHKGDTNWTFSSGGIMELMNHFHVFIEYNEDFIRGKVQFWCEHMGFLCLSPKQEAEVNKIKNETKRRNRIVELSRPHFEALAPYFMALCHTLQEGENEFSAFDAYWLGLIDEVLGVPLFSLRNMLELNPDLPVETT